LVIGVSAAVTVGLAGFVINTAVQNQNVKSNPLGLEELMRMAKDPFAPDPRTDALKAQAAQRERKASLVASRGENKELSPIFIPPKAPGGGGFQPQSFPAGSNPDPGSNKAMGKQMNAAKGWDGEWGCLEKLWDRESGWNERAQNRYSGAYGIAQALPGAKMSSKGSDWQTNPATQIGWGLDYIGGRYKSPCGAWAHSQSTGWY
jgi:hypothetical protein